MKVVVLNGWTQAPHCWRHYWKVNYRRVASGGYTLWHQVNVFGVTFCICP
jgi:hypothetical protein